MKRRVHHVCWAWICLVGGLALAARAGDWQQVIATAQTKVVKIYGAGGLRQLEAYQSGLLISADGQVLTALSYVLDTDDLAVVLGDGRKFQAELVRSDPVSELALLKLPVTEETLPFFDLHQHVARPRPGERILALSNLFGIATGDEQVSVMQGVITAFAPLQTRRTAGAQPQVYVLDASTNNPGAAGGALVDWQGRLLGMLGKERKSQVTGTWLNYALPTPLLETTVQQLRSGQALPPELPPEGEAHTLEELGIVLIPDVLPRTPPYLDGVRRDSPAERAGLRADDLLVLVEDDAVDSAQAVVQRIGRSDRFEPLTLTVLRGGQLSRHTLPPAIDASPPAGTEQP